mmetsp:Transcript_115400/g.200288  ORF Transcript_115400/g.200288 Transcript_115400/m.200288 type:complete len:632 (+) Transcript_115400:47-1942(+)
MVCKADKLPIESAAAPCPYTPFGSSPIARGVSERLGASALIGRFHTKSIEEDYTLTDTVLGRGYGGCVRLAHGKNLHESFAVKHVDLDGHSEEQKRRLQNEVQIYLCMDHPHIAQLVDVYEFESRMDIVMECMHGGELYDRVTTTLFSEEDAVNATLQMLLALNYIHSFGVVHRDLKLENFVYDSWDSRHLKLIDFGFSKFRTKRQRMKTNCGTLAYTAPEVLARSAERSYTSQCDLWSLGVIVYILLSNRMPFAGSDKEMQEKILCAQYEMEPEIWGELSDDAGNFVESLLQLDPGARLTAEEALAHPWLARRGRRSTSSTSSAHVHVDPAVVAALKEYAQAPKLQRCCRSLLAWMVPSDERAKVSGIFKTIDTDNDGIIRLSDLEYVMADGYNMSTPEVSQILDTLESKCHKEIRYSDFLAAMLYHKYALHEDVLHAGFNKLKGADSGEIGAEELRQVVGDSFEDEAVETLICQADSNNDGLLSYDDFEICVRGKSPLATPRGDLTPSWGSLTLLSPVRQTMRGGIPVTPPAHVHPELGSMSPSSSRSKGGQRPNRQPTLRSLVGSPLMEIDELFHMSSEQLTPRTPTLLESMVSSQQDSAKSLSKQEKDSLLPVKAVHSQGQACCGVM